MRRLLGRAGGKGVRVVGLVGEKEMGKFTALEWLRRKLRGEEGFYKTVWFRGRVYAGERARRTVKRIKDLSAASLLYAQPRFWLMMDELIGSRRGPSSNTQRILGDDAGDDEEDEKLVEENQEDFDASSNVLSGDDNMDEKQKLKY